MVSWPKIIAKEYIWDICIYKTVLRLTWYIPCHCNLKSSFWLSDSTEISMFCIRYMPCITCCWVFYNIHILCIFLSSYFSFNISMGCLWDMTTSWISWRILRYLSIYWHIWKIGQRCVRGCSSRLPLSLTNQENRVSKHLLNNNPLLILSPSLIYVNILWDILETSEIMNWSRCPRWCHILMINLT